MCTTGIGRRDDDGNHFSMQPLQFKILLNTRARAFHFIPEIFIFDQTRPDVTVTNTQYRRQQHIVKTSIYNTYDDKKVEIKQIVLYYIFYYYFYLYHASRMCTRRGEIENKLEQILNYPSSTYLSSQYVSL